MIIPIWVGNKFTPVRIRLIGGDAELLLAVGIIGRLSLSGGRGKRNFHSGQGEWPEMARNSENRWVSPLFPVARGCGKLEAYFAKMRIAIWKF